MSAFCIRHAQLIVGAAATLLPASLFVVMEALRGMWQYDFRPKGAAPFWRRAFRGGVVLTGGTWALLVGSYTILVSLYVKDSYNLSFKTASCVLHAAPVLLFILAHGLQGWL